MKRILLSLLPLMAVFFLTVSCDPTQVKPEAQDTLTLSPTSLDFEAEDASTKLVYVTTEKDWTATPPGEDLRYRQGNLGGDGRCEPG